MGATIRIYAESFERDPERHNRETQVQTALIASRYKSAIKCDEQSKTKKKRKKKSVFV